MIQSIATQAIQYESLKSQKLFDDISHEQKIMGCRSKTNSIKQHLDSALKDSRTLRSKLSELESAKILLEAELATSKTTSSTTSDKVLSLEQRLTEVSDEKRQLLENINQKTKNIKELTDERDNLRKSGLETRKSIIGLETQIQQLQSFEISTKAREQNQKQEIELLKQNSEWLKGELEKKSTEYSKFRNEKVGLISRLQNDLSNTQSSLQILKKSNETLKTQFYQTSNQLNETLLKVEELQDAKVSNEEHFRVEMVAQKRLLEVWERSAKDAKKRVQEMEGNLSTLRERETKEVEKWKLKATKETERANALAKQITLLEGQIENALVQPETPPFDQTSKSSTGGFSPSATIIAEIRSSGSSLTQLYTDYKETKTRLERERLKNNKLREQMNEIVKDMESHAPAVLAEREENVRLEHELTEMSIQLEESIKTSESATEKLKEVEIQSHDYQREAKLLGKQVNDLSRQVQHLLIQNKLVSDTANPLTADEYAGLQKILQGDNTPNQTDTDKIISQRLVLFKNTVELQKQNANLLKVTRELGLRMENKEKEAAQKVEEIESSVITEAKETIVSLQQDVDSLNAKIEGLQRERDMFRRIVSTKADDGISRLDNIENTAEGSANTQIQHLIKQNNELSARAKDLETQLSNIRCETSETVKSIDAKNAELTAERADLQIKLAKTESRLELAEERQKNSNSNLEIIRSENEDFKKRTNSLQTTISTQDLRIQKLAEDLLVANSATENIRNENATLKAEKSIWKSIEERLTKDNADLIEQRGRLNALLSNSQALENERAASAAEMNKHLNKQIADFEAEAHNLRKKLDAQTEELTITSQKHNANARDFQERIRQLTADLSKANQELLSSKSDCEKLHVSYNNIQSQLDVANEKIKDLELIDSTPGSREFVLSQEVSTLKSSLDATKAELDLSKKTVDELRNVASTAEKALQDMNNTHDMFKASTEKIIAEKEASVGKFKDQLASINKILESTRQTYSQLDNERQVKIKSLETEQQRLQGLVDVLQSNETKLNEEIGKIKADLSQQSKLASDARADYEQEVVKHAEATNTLKALRAECLELKTNAAELKKVADSAAEKLSSSESSWASQKYSYEQQIETLNLHSEDISAQNRLLLDQLEKANNGQKQENPPNYEDAVSTQDIPLRELVAALRREKEIVDTKYELNLQESKRLKQKLEHITAELDKARVEIEEFRQAHDSQQSINYQKQIQDQENDLTILRESNTTLRQQSTFYSNKVTELEKNLEDIQSKLQPLQSKLLDAVADNEVKDQQIKLLQQEATDWKTRTQNILHKYERIDPKVVNDLKENNEKLTKDLEAIKAKYISSIAEVSETKLKFLNVTNELNIDKNKFGNVSNELNDVKNQLESANKDLASKTEEVNNLNARFAKLKTEFQDKLRKNRGNIISVKEKLELANAEIARLNSQSTTDSSVAAELESTKKEYDTAKSELEAVKQNVVQLTAQIESLKTQPQSQVDESVNAELASVKEQLANTNAELAVLKESATGGNVNEELVEKTKRIISLEEEVNRLSDQIVDLQNQSKEGDISKLKESNKLLTQKVEELTKSANNNAPSNSISLEEHKKKLDQMRVQLENKAKNNVAKEKKSIEDQWLTRFNGVKESAKKQINDIVQNRKNQLENEYKEKEKALKEAQAKAGNINEGNASDGNAIKSLEQEVKSLKENAAEEKKKAIEMTRKEFDMRIRLLQSKAEKAEAEKNALKTKLSAYEDSSEAEKPSGQQPHRQNLNQDNTSNAVQNTSQPQQQGSTGNDLVPNFSPKGFQGFNNSAGNTPNNSSGSTTPNSNQNIPKTFQFQNSSGFKGMQGSKFPTMGGFQGRFKPNFNSPNNNASVNQMNFNSKIPTHPSGKVGFGNNATDVSNAIVLSSTPSTNSVDSAAIPFTGFKNNETKSGSADKSSNGAEVSGIKRPIDGGAGAGSGEGEGNDSKRAKNEGA